MHRAHDNPAGGEQAQNSMATVSARGRMVWVLMQRLHSSCMRSMAFEVRIEGEQSVAGLLQAVRLRSISGANCQ